MTAPTVPRREQLLEAAAALFAERGYAAVGIDDIGAAAGISGPGVYRHFASKQALLAALCDRALDRMLAGAQDISTASDDARVRLEALVELHVGFAVEERALIGVWGRELPALSDDLRRSLRRRMRAYEQPWREVLACLRPELEPAEVAVVSGATLAMLNAAALMPTGVSRERLALLLRTTALAALLAPTA